MQTGRDQGDLVIRLESEAAPDETDWNRIRLSARDLITDPGALAGRLREDRSSVDVSDLWVPRISSIALTSRVASRPSGRDDHRSCA